MTAHHRSVHLIPPWSSGTMGRHAHPRPGGGGGRGDAGGGSSLLQHLVLPAGRRATTSPSRQRGGWLWLVQSSYLHKRRWKPDPRRRRVDASRARAAFGRLGRPPAAWPLPGRGCSAEIKGTARDPSEGSLLSLSWPGSKEIVLAGSSRALAPFPPLLPPGASSAEKTLQGAKT